MRQLPLGIRLRDRARFESYLAGPNSYLVAQLRALARGESGIVWLHGPEASGKTHLLQAVIAACAEQARIAYLPLAELPALAPGILDGWLSFDCVCIDDLQRVIGNTAFERALFSLYRDVEERRARLLVAAQAAPRSYDWALSDIGSRFAACSVLRLRELDDRERSDALRLRAALRGLELPADAARYLQRRVRRDMKTLCSLLDTLDEAALVAQRRITVPFLRQVLGDPPSE
jgi:DnaA family protein